MGVGSMYEVIEALSSLSRTGWMLRGVPSALAESVAEHSFASAVIAFELAVRLRDRGVEIDPYRAALVALVHDVGESVIGDIAKTAGIGDAKREAELRAVKTLPFSNALKELVIEFEESSSVEALVARVSESLATILKARSYVSLGYTRVKEIEDNLKRYVSSLLRDRLELRDLIREVIAEALGLTL